MIDLPLMKPMLFATVLACTAACSGVDPVRYSGLASSPQLVANPRDDAGTTPFRTATPVAWRSYTKAIVEPVTIYSGPDNQFGSMSEADKAILARHMQTEFTRRLASRFQIVQAPSPGTVRVKLTLTGATTTTPVVGTFTHLDLAGNLYNAIQAVRGREGLIAGSVLYAVELSDASTNALLSAYVAKQFPGALNVMASFGTLEAAKVGIGKGADDLVTQLQ